MKATTTMTKATKTKNPRFLRGEILGGLATLAILMHMGACTRAERATHARDGELALSIGHALAEVCPAGDDPADEAARNRCAEKLTELPLLRGAMREPFLWGGQKTPGDYRLTKGTSKFNARVWRRMYLSTFMFEDAPVVERVGELTVLHVPTHFRHAMPMGAFPYPFWHSSGKWDSYSYSTTIHLIVEDGAVIGALRSIEQDRARPMTPHTWDGRWRWEDGAGQMPYVSIYGYLFSKENLYVGKLDESYRALEAQMRAHRCPTCHAPDNKGSSDQLEFFVYPNQALAGRHDIIAQIGDDQMPPENALGITPGISDPARREEFLAAARAFEAAGDAALSWEGDGDEGATRLATRPASKPTARPTRPTARPVAKPVE